MVHEDLFHCNTFDIKLWIWHKSLSVYVSSVVNTICREVDYINFHIIISQVGSRARVQFQINILNPNFFKTKNPTLEYAPVYDTHTWVLVT